MKKAIHTSLGEQVSNKMSVWILILIIALSTGIFFVSYLLSKQMFNQQVNIWHTVTPQYALSNLIDSDHFSIAKEIKILESTGLFSSFVITDNQKKIIAKFGGADISKSLIPIRDDGKVVWGYYAYQTNFIKFISPFLIAGMVFSIIVLCVYFISRRRIKKSLNNEFASFNQFLNDIEILSEKINEIHVSDKNTLQLQIKPAKNLEQEIIHRSIARLINEIEKANKSLREAVYETEQKRFQEELTRTGLQIAHDLGSPLAVLETLVQSNSVHMQEDSRVALRNVAARIRDITISFLIKAKKDLFLNTTESFKQYDLLSLLMQIISEKRLQFSSNPAVKMEFNFDKSSYGLFALLKAADFERIISNLINNAVEAIQGKEVLVRIFLSRKEKCSVISIQDNGHGIPDHVLKKIGQLGFTSGKTNGSGLGLYHAKVTLENWGGELSINSTLGKGTTVNLSLPLAQTPAWHTPEICLSSRQEICIIDDDESIHTIWKKRFSDLELETGQCIKLQHFYSPDELIQWQEKDLSCESMRLYLCDYEFLGSSINGLDLINKLKINYLSILVTSQFNNDQITLNCEAMGVKMLSKDMASLISLRYLGQ